MANVRNAYARNLPSNIARHVFQRVQTTGNGHAISTSLIVARPETPLKHKELIDVQKVLEFKDDYSSNVSIAVEHSKKGVNDTSLYVAFIQNGAIVLKRALPKYRMEEHEWIDVNETIKDVEDATHVSITFDGIMTIKRGGKSEFITEKEPWVFWINEAQECWAEKLGHPNTRFQCAKANCTYISAFRATWSEVSKFNFGLMVFMLLNGSIYYRQYIDGVWYNAAPINFGPANTTFTSMKVHRTWDYRICIQAKTTDGKIYEMFSQFEGIGTRNVEHLSLDSIHAHGTAVPINYAKNVTKEEHIVATKATVTDKRIRWGQPIFVISGVNVDNGNGDYGRIVDATFDHSYDPSTIEGSGEAWTLTDSEGTTFKSVRCEPTDGSLTVRIYFRNFNTAVGDCILHYEPGTIATDVVASNAFDYKFTPIGLSIENVHIPEVTEVYNE